MLNTTAHHPSANDGDFEALTGGGVEPVFTYTLTDADGDGTATLT